MLEALQDIEIASKLVGFDNDNGESLDDKYMKLRCNIAPLPHDSEDYKLVERYLLNTHAPTHKVWPCVFAVFILLIFGVLRQTF
jgi:poly [ADP-ribose] polymerase